MRRWTYFIVVFLATGHPVAHAQDTSIQALRKELEALSQSSSRSRVSPGTLRSIQYTLDVAERIGRGFPAQSARWKQRAHAYIRTAKQGQDPYLTEQGQIVPRGYQSALSTVLQGYAVYIPPTYDPSRTYPMMVVLHGGSSNGNLFLGVVLGNNLNWKNYPQHLYDEFTPRWTPDWIVVAPTGFGQVLWRWMGEQDVLDVIDDVQKHYNVDPNHIVLSGLSNGGLGAYSIGMRHASRFSTVMAMAGAPGWHQYANAAGAPMHERTAIAAVSGYDLAENAFNTDFRFYHGRTDTGPMRPSYVHEFEKHLIAQHIPHKATWYNLGHDILYPVHKHGEIYSTLNAIKRKDHPNEVKLVTGDYRANTQHWLSITRFESYPQLAKASGTVRGATIELNTHNTVALALDLRHMPLEPKANVTLIVDTQTVYQGPRASLGHVLHVVREGASWKLGFPKSVAKAANAKVRWEKQPGISGPLTDAYYGPMLHVYGTQRPDDQETLKKAAEKGAKGWPLWLWDYQQPVLADHEITEAHMRQAHLVLYATPGANRVLERIAKDLPIQVQADAIIMANQRYQTSGVGTRFIFPNPLNPNRYVIVQAAPDAKGVMAGHNLPDFLADYVIYDATSTRTRPRLTAGKQRPLASGYFDRYWRVPGTHAATEPTNAKEPRRTSSLSILPAPPSPPQTRWFSAPESDPAGKTARRIAELVQEFPNFRAEIAGATWTLDSNAVFRIRSSQECLRSLQQKGIKFSPATGLSTPVPTPVEVRGTVKGISFQSWDPQRPVVVACELADRLPLLADVLRKHGVVSVEVLSSYRDHPKVSFHTFGLALDVSAFRTRQQWLSVLKHFELTPQYETCNAPPAARPTGQALRDLACGIAASGYFSSVLTPNYNIGHRNHFHIDARPNDPRLYVR